MTAMYDGLTLEERMKITRYTLPVLGSNIAVEAGFDGNSSSYYAQVFYLDWDTSEFYGPPDFDDMATLAGLLHRVGDLLDTKDPDFFVFMHALMVDPIAVELKVLHRKNPRATARSIDLVQSVIDRQIVGYGEGTKRAVPTT